MVNEKLEGVAGLLLAGDLEGVRAVLGDFGDQSISPEDRVAFSRVVAKRLQKRCLELGAECGALDLRGTSVGDVTPDPNDIVGMLRTCGFTFLDLFPNDSRGDCPYEAVMATADRWKLIGGGQYFTESFEGFTPATIVQVVHPADAWWLYEVDGVDPHTKIAPVWEDIRVTFHGESVEVRGDDSITLRDVDVVVNAPEWNGGALLYCEHVGKLFCGSVLSVTLGRDGSMEVTR